eukprot:370328-Rhodomonas_salina.1
MGADCTTINDNQYASLFLIRKSRYTFVFLHKTKDEIPSIMLKAFAYVGGWPKIISSDGAGEYHSPEMDKMFEEKNIWHQTSCAFEQHQNAVPEKFVDVVGGMMRTSLLQSNLPIAFWGAALLYAVDCHNSTPHSSMQFECPQFLHNGRRPDIAWHKPFGCSTTVFRCKHLSEHHKLTARGEAGVFIGLGTQHRRKSWLVYSPKQNRIYLSRNVTFDETLFPLRDHDQRFYGVMQHQRLDSMRNDMDIDYDIAQDLRHLPTLPEPVWTADDISERPRALRSDLQAGTTTLSQKQYVVDLLERTGMSGATST